MGPATVSVECPHCGGTGWRITERDGVSAASKCSCATEARTGRVLAGARIPPNYAAASFENFALPPDNPIARQALATTLLNVRAFSREYPLTDKPGLMFIGDPGTGKTHLAVAVLKILIEKGYEGIFFDYLNLLDRIRSSYNETSGAADREAYRQVLDADVLLLDDLGAHRINEWVEDTVTSIITWRCNHRKTTIVTTNCYDADAASIGSGGMAKTDHRITLGERIGMRARSRLFEMCRVVKMPQIEDYRIRKSR